MGVIVGTSATEPSLAQPLVEPSDKLNLPVMKPVMAQSLVHAMDSVSVPSAQNFAKMMAGHFDKQKGS